MYFFSERSGTGHFFGCGLLALPPGKEETFFPPPSFPATFFLPSFLPDELVRKEDKTPQERVSEIGQARRERIDVSKMSLSLPLSLRVLAIAFPSSLIYEACEL